MQMRNNFRQIWSFIPAVVLMAAATFNINAQELGDQKPDQQAIVDQLKSKSKSDLAAEQAAAAREQAAAIKGQTKAQTDAAKAAADRAVAEKEAAKNKSVPFYLQTWFWLLIVAGLVVVLVFRFRAFRSGGGAHHVIVLLFAASMAASMLVAAPCVGPHGEPFRVAGVTVIKDKPTSPARLMIYPEQTRKLLVAGCGFGFDQARVSVGFGPGLDVSLGTIRDGGFELTVEAKDDVALGTRYLAVAVLDVHDRKNYQLTDWKLEVVPKEAYAALQLIEIHGATHPAYRPGPMVDRTARIRAIAAAHNAEAALEFTKSNSAAIKDTAAAVSGAAAAAKQALVEVASLRKDVDELKSRMKSVENELRYDDGSSVLDDLSARMKALEGKTDGVTRQEFESLKAEVEKILGARVKTGMFRSQTIGERISQPEKGGWKHFGNRNQVPNTQK